ncbi:hypothetical protein HDU82_009092, partial [Entophlyctis luteolus]
MSQVLHSASMQVVVLADELSQYGSEPDTEEKISRQESLLHRLISIETDVSTLVEMIATCRTNSVSYFEGPSANNIDEKANNLILSPREHLENETSIDIPVRTVCEDRSGELEKIGDEMVFEGTVDDMVVETKKMPRKERIELQRRKREEVAIPFLVRLVALGAAGVNAIGCAITDISQNLYVFGASYGDLNLGSVESTWVSSSAPTSFTSLTSLANRPPFDTANPTCSFAPYLNYITVLNGDSSKGMSVLHVFDTTSSTWSIVPLTGTDSPSTTNYVATLDHDTNVIYAYSNGIMYRIDYANSLDQLAKNPSLTLEWLSEVNGNAQPFTGSSYTSPVMGQGTNHLHFSNQPGLSAGQTVYIPSTDQSKVPNTFAYTPDDGTATILIDVNTNTSTILSGFGNSGSTYCYAATSSYIVQFDTTGGKLKVLPVLGGDVLFTAVLPTVTQLPSVSVVSITTTT